MSLRISRRLWKPFHEGLPWKVITNDGRQVDDEEAPHTFGLALEAFVHQSVVHQNYYYILYDIQGVGNMMIDTKWCFME